MRIGCLREIKDHEYRVGLTPHCAKAYRDRGHEVSVQTGAGAAAGFPDDAYAAAGATILDDAQAVSDASELLIKVKEPLSEEFDLLRAGQTLFTYLHLAANESLTRTLQERRVRAVAYETIRRADGSLPCLKPMSEIAGRLAAQQGAKYLEKTFGGRGVLLAGVPGVQRGRVVILGGGVVGANACTIAAGMGAHVTILDIDANRLAHLDDIHGSRIQTLYATEHNIEKLLANADVVVGAVLVPGAKAPKLVRREHLSLMKPGAVLVDVAVDQGGCFETTRPTSHSDPVFIDEGIVHYCVANMPGAVALTATLALTSTTLPYGLMIAEQGVEAAITDPALAAGVNVWDGHIVHRGVADAFGEEAVDLARLIG